MTLTSRRRGFFQLNPTAASALLTGLGHAAQVPGAGPSDGLSLNCGGSLPRCSSAASRTAGPHHFCDPPISLISAVLGYAPAGDNRAWRRDRRRLPKIVSPTAKRAFGASLIRLSAHLGEGCPLFSKSEDGVFSN